MTVDAVVRAIQKYRDLESSQTIIESDFRLACQLDTPASAAEIQEAFAGRKIDEELVNLWGECRSARLFEDIDYGQWGLLILPPAITANKTTTEHDQRPNELLACDLVIGEFLGDLDILVISPSERTGRRVMVAPPLDPRDEWYGVGESIAEFLDKFYQANGEKYWEN